MNHALKEIRDNPSVALMAAYGAATGYFEYGIRPHLTSKRAWGALALGILAYEMAAPQGELLSEGTDRALGSHPYLTRLGIGLVACHLANALPPRYDPIHQLFKLKGAL